MTKVPLLSRVFLGLTFTVFGLNGFLGFIKLPTPGGVAGQFMGALVDSGYLIPVFALQLIAGVLLLTNRFVPLALVLLAPIIVNIALYHALMEPHGLATAAVTIALWALVFHQERSAFAGLLSGSARHGAGPTVRVHFPPAAHDGAACGATNPSTNSQKKKYHEQDISRSIQQ